MASPNEPVWSREDDELIEAAAAVGLDCIRELGALPGTALIRAISMKSTDHDRKVINGHGKESTPARVAPGRLANTGRVRFASTDTIKPTGIIKAGLLAMLAMVLFAGLFATLGGLSLLVLTGAFVAFVVYRRKQRSEKLEEPMVLRLEQGSTKPDGSRAEQLALKKLDEYGGMLTTVNLERLMGPEGFGSLTIKGAVKDLVASGHIKQPLLLSPKHMVLDFPSRRRGSARNLKPEDFA